ncbi:MAG: glycosyltransferase family 87 protein [Bacteroidales bacterium]|nr:glycosyltransferase family 87 protein [Bacteroidales bacterium]
MKTFIRQHYKWIIFLALVSLGSLAGELINKRLGMPDLEVYHKTTERLLQGEELYRTAEEDPYEHYVYKYSPPAAFIFIPFVFTGFAAAKYLYWFFLTLILGHTLYLLQRILIRSDGLNNRMIISIMLAIVITGTHFFRELHLGQVNLLLLWLYVVALYALCWKKPLLTGIPLAVSLFLKPFALIFIPFLLITGHYKALANMLLFALIMFGLPFIFYPEMNNFLGLYASWLNELAIELNNKQELLAAGNHTIFSVLARYSPLRFMALEGIAGMIYQLCLLLIITGILLWFLIRDKSRESNIRIYIILIALIPLLAYTSYNAFILTLPLTAYLLFHFRELSLPWKILFIFSSILIGGNIYDLVGSSLFDLFWAISVYAWGSLGMLLIIFINWHKFSRSVAK